MAVSNRPRHDIASSSWTAGVAACALYRLTCQTARVQKREILTQPCRRDSSAPSFGRRGVRRHFPSPHPREGAERRKALGRHGTFAKAPRALRSARSPSGAPLVASLDLGAIFRGADRRAEPSACPGGFRRRRSVPVQPLKADPRSRAGRLPEATRGGVCETQAAGATPGSAARRL